MPELPEVETVALGLRHLSGRALRSLELIDSRVWFESELEPEALRGRVLLEVARRGKYLLLRFEGGLTLVQHLRMTGKMLEAHSLVVPQAVRVVAGERKGKGLQIRCRFLFDGLEIWFFDPRRFGTLSLVADEMRYFRRKEIAPDPLREPEEARALFLERMGLSSKPVKSALLDQAIAAGVGNIYADEALHRVGLHPLHPACRLDEALRLWKEIQYLFHRALELGGSTVRDYVSSSGEAGKFAKELRVYAREGEPCYSCGSEIQKMVVGGRSTHFCIECQPKASMSSRAKKAKSGPPKERLARGKGALRPKKYRKSPGRSRD